MQYCEICKLCRLFVCIQNICDSKYVSGKRRSHISDVTDQCTVYLKHTLLLG